MRLCSKPVFVRVASKTSLSRWDGHKHTSAVALVFLGPAARMFS